MDAMPQHFGLTLMVNHACNLRCAYCYTGAKFHSPMQQAIGEIAMDRAMRTVVEAGILELGFFGGEPLLESTMIAHWMRYAGSRAAERRQRVRFSMTTNGTQVSRQAWEVMMAPNH